MGMGAGVNESLERIAFKKVGIDILKEKGFSPTEIHEEYDVEYKIDGKIKYKVDLAGIKDGYKVAVECGGSTLSKLLNLRKIFDEAIVVDTAKVVEVYEYWKTKYLNDTERLELENRRLKEQLKWVYGSRIGPLEEKVEKLEHELLSLQARLRSYQKVMAQAWEAVKEQS
jgi:hypothetical protein